MLTTATVILCVAQLALSQQLPLSASPSGWPQQQLQSYNRFTASRGYNNPNSYQVPNDAAANGAFLSSTAQRAFANWNARAPTQPSYASLPSVQQPVSNYIPTAPSSSLPEWARALAPSTTQQQYSTSPQYTITSNAQQQNSNSPQFTTTSNVQQQSQYSAWNPASAASATNTNSRFSLIAPSPQQSNTDTTSRTSQQQTYSPDSTASYAPSQSSPSSSFGSSSSGPNTLTTGEVQQALNILLQQQASGSTNPMVSSAIQAINALQSSQPGQQQTTSSDASPTPSFAAAAAAYTPSTSQQTSSSAGQYGSSGNSDSSNAFVSNAIRDSLKGFGGGRAQTTQDYSASPSAYLSQPQRIQPSFANVFGNQNSARSPFQVPNYNSVSPSSSSAYIPRVSHDSPPLSELQQRFSGGQYASSSSPYGSAADSDRSVDSFRRIGGSRSSSSGGRPSWATS